MPNENFHSAFAQICATILSITLAFYGILGINLAQQAQTYRGSITQNLQTVDDAVGELSYITEPPRTSWSNWTIPLERDSNAQWIMDKERWQNSPTEILNPTVENILGNFTNAQQRDNDMRDYLNQMNVSRWITNYLEVIFSLHTLVNGIYHEFPPPPGLADYWHVVDFVSIAFPKDETTFRNWSQRFELYYSGVSEIRSRIGSALQGISEAYLEDSKSQSQTLEWLIQQNRTDDWTVNSFQDAISYDIGMFSYYTSIFDSLSNIHSQVAGTVANMDLYNRVYSLAFSAILGPVILTAVTGVAIPMLLLGISGYIDGHKANWKPWWRWIYFLIVAVSIIGFLVGLSLTVDVLWHQISQLYLT